MFKDRTGKDTIEMEFDSGTADILICMPYVSMLKMMHIVTGKIQPEDLNNADSIGEQVLTDFIRKLFKLNTEVMEEGAKCETENAIAEAEKIVNPERQV